MHVRRLISLVAGLSLTVAAGPAAAASVGSVLDGRWAGDGFELRIDAERSLANVDPERPFDWQRFIVKDVDGRRVVFTVGTRLFMAEIGEEGMILTGFDFPGEIRLTRQAKPEPEPVAEPEVLAEPADEDAPGTLRPALDADLSPGAAAEPG